MILHTYQIFIIFLYPTTDETMKVTKYEIDMLNVGAADASLIHFYDDEDNDKEYIILVDAGNYSDGKTITNFVRKRYGKDEIDLAICSHCDKDHFGGFVYLLEQIKANKSNRLDISKMWVNDPADHVPMGEIIHTNMSKKTISVKARSVYDLGDKGNLLDLLGELNDKGVVIWQEPFSDPSNANKQWYKCYAFDKHIEVLAPSISNYASLVPEFRNDLKRKIYDTDEEKEDSTIEVRAGNVIYSKAIDEAGDDPSSHNQSSVIFFFKPDDGRLFLFMGDAGRDAVDNFAFKNDVERLKGVYWLKVPHHGSKYNLDNYLLNLIKPEVAYISTEKYGHYMSKAVVNALNKCGTGVYDTIGGSMWHHHGTITRDDYHQATPTK